MTEFAYNNAKNASTGYTLFELNCSYHSRVFYKENVDPCSKSKSADDLANNLRELMTVCRKNLHYAQDLQKRAYNKGTKPRSYVPGNKVWLNSKYIKTKQNRKLEAKFFGPFRSYTRWESKHTSSSYQRSGKFMMFFTCHYWSRTPPGRGGWTRM